MNQIVVAFEVYNRNFAEISNNDLYEIRKRLSLILEENGFGNSEEQPDGKFDNLLANKVSDSYYTPENELSISFMWDHWPDEPNFDRFLRHGISDFINFCFAHDKLSSARVVYS